MLPVGAPGPALVFPALRVHCGWEGCWLWVLKPQKVTLSPPTATQTCALEFSPWNVFVLYLLKNSLDSLCVPHLQERPLEVICSPSFISPTDVQAASIRLLPICLDRSPALQEPLGGNGVSIPFYSSSESFSTLFPGHPQLPHFGGTPLLSPPPLH